MISDFRDDVKDAFKDAGRGNGFSREAAFGAVRDALGELTKETQELADRLQAPEADDGVLGEPTTEPTGSKQNFDSFA